MKDNITIYSPGNIVSVTISADMKIIDIEIKDDIFTIEQKPLLEEMISSTINQAYESMLSQLGGMSNNTNDSIENIQNDNSGFMGNMDMMKNMLGDKSIQDAVSSIMGNVKIEYKDGKPYCSMPMDMMDPASMSKIIEMMNKK